MKTILHTLLLVASMFAINLFAQAPQKFNYQGVARNSSGNPISSANIGLRLSITDGTVTLYSESFVVSTNTLGLFNVAVGGGTVESGTFASIDWSTGAKFIKVEMDPAGGTTYTDMGSSQLLSVPYSLYAEKTAPINLDDLTDVNASAPVLNQVLQWNGTEWVPANIGGGGSDNWGSQVINHNSDFSGDGTSGNPLVIAQQGASTGMVLTWNGSSWVPMSASDNWGSQTVSTNVDLGGNGTSANPLTIAQQGATTGQFLRWNGTSWMPASISGDNWGTAVVNTSSQFSGNGTSVNPLILAQQGATPGQNLEWSGISWIPAVDDTLDLPYDGVANSSNTLFRVTNSGTGIGIKGINSSSNMNVTGVVGQIQNVNAGVGSSGVIGVNNGTNGNGYGVYGTHQGGGVGTYGSSATGIGIYGVSVGSGGIGVLAQGNAEGVKGTSNSASGYGVHGVALSGGYGGYFEGRTAVVSNSNAFEPNLFINETEPGDYARIRMSNPTPGQFWEIDALNTGVAATEMFHIWNGINGALLSIRGDGNVGMGNTNPTQRLDVAGNIKFSGALMPNNTAGSTGQVLTSQGAGVAPTWTSSTNFLFNNIYFFNQSLHQNLISTSPVSLQFNGQQYAVFTVPANSKIMVTFNQGLVENSSGTDDEVYFFIKLLDNSNNLVNQAVVIETLKANENRSVSYTHHCYISMAGTYKVEIVAQKVNASSLIGIPMAGGQMQIEVIPQ